MKQALRLLLSILVLCHAAYAPVAAATQDTTTDHEIVTPTVIEDVTVPDDSLPLPIESQPSTAPAVIHEIEVPVVVDEGDDPPLVLPPLLINRVVAGTTGHTTYEYVELYNPNPVGIFVDSWQLHILRKEGNGQVFSINGTIGAHSYMLFAGADAALDELQSDFRIATSPGIVTTGGIVQLVDTTQTIRDYVSWGDTPGATLTLPTGRMLERQYIDTIPSITGSMTKDFVSKLIDTQLPRGGGYIAYVAPVNRCEGIIISEIAANVAVDQQFVELYNPTDHSIDTTGCLLQTNRSTTKHHELSGTVQPGQYIALPIAAIQLTLTKTTTGTVYLLSSDGKEETDARSYDSLATNTSWSWFGEGDWRQTFALTPNAPNAWQEFLPCSDGYERNSETGRCRKIAVEQPPEDCGEGKYRNPDTGRCRSIETASTLTPCKEGQYRNPETNRCRSVTTASTVLVPCKAGQERNPETNRCRNATAAVPVADFAVAPIADTGKAFVGWLALGGIGLLAVGYGAWEWRREVVAGVQKVRSFFTSSK